MPEIDVVVRRAGNSLDLRVPKGIARKLGLVEGRRLRVRIDDEPDFAQFMGAFKGRLDKERAHAATNEDEELE